MKLRNSDDSCIYVRCGIFAHRVNSLLDEYASRQKAKKTWKNKRLVFLLSSLRRSVGAIYRQNGENLWSLRSRDAGQRFFTKPNFPAGVAISHYKFFSYKKKLYFFSSDCLSQFFWSIFNVFFVVLTFPCSRCLFTFFSVCFVCFSSFAFQCSLLFGISFYCSSAKSSRKIVITFSAARTSKRAPKIRFRYF